MHFDQPISNGMILHNINVFKTLEFHFVAYFMTLSINIQTTEQRWPNLLNTEATL